MDREVQHKSNNPDIDSLVIDRYEDRRQRKGKRVSGQWVLDPVVDAQGRNPLAEEESVQADDINAD